MLEQTTLQGVVVKIRNREKQDAFTIDVTLNEFGEINLPEVFHKINEIYSMEEGLMFYFDHFHDTYVSFHSDQLASIHQSSLINESKSYLISDMIILRFQPKISDQLLANHEIKPEEVRTKRSRQRIIADVFQIVEQWRLLYLQGIQNEKGEREKINLDQAASMLSTPRKSLEDYFLLLRNGKSYGFDYKTNFRSKVGILRTFVKKHKKEEKQPKKQFKERSFLKGLRRQIFGITPEEFENQIFGEARDSGSDEDLIFFQH